MEVQEVQIQVFVAFDVRRSLARIRARQIDSSFDNFLQEYG